MEPATTAAVIGGAASILGAGTSAVAQSSLNKKTREFNREEAEKQRLWSEEMYNKQNAWNYQMWKEQNEYNSPVNQVQRMLDAGLNPLYYGLDGSSAGDISAAQPLGYERASIGNQVNPFAGFGSGAVDAAAKAAQVTSLDLDNQLKKKELDWYDKEHQQAFDFGAASIDDIRQRISESKSRVENNEMDVLLKAKDLDKKDAEIATEVARCAGLGLDNALKEKLNPLMLRAQELENQLAETHNKYEEQRILAELGEIRGHTAALYAQAALDGARKEGVNLENLVKREDAKFAKTNAQNRANLLKWTAGSQKQKLHISINDSKNSDYYTQHYEEAFRNSWSKSGVEYGITEKLGEGLGTAALLGLMLAF